MHITRSNWLFIDFVAGEEEEVLKWVLPYLANGFEFEEGCIKNGALLGGKNLDESFNVSLVKNRNVERNTCTYGMVAILDKIKNIPTHSDAATYINKLPPESVVVAEIVSRGAMVPKHFANGVIQQAFKSGTLRRSDTKGLYYKTLKA